MPLLPDPLFPVVRTLHVVAGVVWLGALWLSTWLDHRVLPGMKDASWGEFAPRMAAVLWPWLSGSALLTVLLGLWLYADLGMRIGLPNMAWSVTAGGALAFVVVALQFAIIVPHQRSVARGSRRPSPERHRRIARVGLSASVVSAVVITLMLGATRLGGFFR